jgi:photosystem II stability/assembly factor-like uncharacterized protein
MQHPYGGQRGRSRARVLMIAAAAQAACRPAANPTPDAVRAASASDSQHSASGAGAPPAKRDGARTVEQLSRPNASGYRWGSVKIGGGGFVSGLIPPRQGAGAWFARTDVGGAYRYDAAERRWVALLDWVSEEETGFLGVESIALDPQAPERVYMLVGISYFNQGKTAVLRSNDFGQSFSISDVTSQLKAHGNGMGRQSGERLAVDPGDGRILFTGTRAQGLFKSGDRGASWQHVDALDVAATPNGNGIAFVLFDPRPARAGRATQGLYVGVSRPEADNLYVSADAGTSWRAIAGQPRGFTPQRAVLSSAGVLYVTYGNGPGPHGTEADAMDRGAVWKLDTHSGVWTEITPLRAGQNRAFCGISVDAADPNRLLTTTVNTYLPQPWGHGDRIFLSRDGGASWSDLIAEQRVVMDPNGFPWIENHSIHWAGSVEIDPFDPERALVVSGNGVFMTENLSATPSTWKFAVEGLEETVPLDAVSVPGGPLISVIGDYDGFVHDDLSQSPARGRLSPTMGTTHSLALAAQKPNILARVGSELYRSTDGAAHWTKVARPSQEKNGRVALSADGAVLLWSAGSVVQRTGDAGESWTRVRGLDFAAAPAGDAVDSSLFYAYAAKTGAVHVSRDGGQSFTKSATLAAGGSERIRPVPGVRGELWVALHDHGLWRSTSAGNEFERVPNVASCVAVGFGAGAPGQAFPAVYLWGAANGGPVGVYRSDDRGRSFVRINDDAHAYGGPANGQFVLGDANVYGRVFMSSAGRGIVFGQLE